MGITTNESAIAFDHRGDDKTEITILLQFLFKSYFDLAWLSHKIFIVSFKNTFS